MDDRSERIARRFDWPVLIAASLVIPVIALEESSWSGQWHTATTVANWLIWLTFTAELVTMLIVAPHKRRWAVHHPLEVLVVVLAPPFGWPGLQSIRLIRLLRLVRLLRLAQQLHRVFTPEGLQYAALLALAVALTGGGAFSYIEGKSAFEGFYWAITTMTTVGYGDQLPTTDASKVIALVVMLSGIGFVAVLTGAIAERFFRPDVARVEQEVHDVGETEDDVMVHIQDISQRLQQLEKALKRKGIG